MLDGRKRARTERLGIRPVFHELHEHFITVEVHEIGWWEGLAEFAREAFRIGVADAEGNERADIAEHGLPDGKRELLNVLM